MSQYTLREHPGRRWELVGTSDTALEEVRRAEHYLVLFRPGGHYPGGTGQPWHYAPAEYQVWRLEAFEPTGAPHPARMIVSWPARGWRG